MTHDVRIPLRFLRESVPHIINPDELHISLALFRLAAEAPHDAEPVPEDAVFADEVLRSTLRISGSASGLDDRIADALELAVGRGTFLRFVATAASTEAAWYLPNTPGNRSLVQRMQSGELPPPRSVWDGERAPGIISDPPTVFRIYEENIGPLTPLIADQLTQAAGEYSVTWIEEAIGEAVSYNKRSWRYIQRILENWRQSGYPGN